MSDTRDRGFTGLVKTLKSWTTEILGLVNAIVGGWLLYDRNPGAVAYVVAVLSGGTLWAWCLHVLLAKRNYVSGGVRPYVYKTKERAAALAGAVAVPIVAACIIYIIVFPHPIACPPSTVTVAGFHSAPGDSTLAERIRINLITNFNQKAHKIVLKDRGAFVRDEHEDEREEAAKRLGKSGTGRSHLVLYGEILKPDPPIKVQVYVVRANTCDLEPGNGRPREVRLSAAQPERLGLEVEAPTVEEMANQLRDVARVVTGMVLYDQMAYDQALEVLQQSTSTAAAMYEGLINWERERLKPDGDISKALEYYQRVLKPDWSAEIDDEIKAATSVNAGNAFLEWTDSDHSLYARIKTACNFYEKAIRYCDLHPKKDREYEWPLLRLWAAAKNNLAVAKIQLAHISGPGEMKDWFSKAEQELEEVRRDCPKTECESEWPTTASNLASLWFELSRMESDRTRKLDDARVLLNEVADTFDEHRSTYEWAVVQSNLGAVLTALAMDGSGRVAGKHLSDAKRCFQNASAVFTKEKHTSEWAQNAGYEAFVVAEQSRQAVRNESGRSRPLDQAVKDCIEALTLHESTYPPGNPKYNDQYRVRSKIELNLAYAIREQARIARDPEQRRSLLQEATDRSKPAVLVLAVGPPPEHAKAQQSYADSLSELALLTEGEERAQKMEEAKRLYQAAQVVWGQYGFLYDQRKIEEALMKF